MMTTAIMVIRMMMIQKEVLRVPALDVDTESSAQINQVFLSFNQALIPCKDLTNTRGGIFINP